ncbi:hypothetical protein GEMRC1_013109 [Eukaryota sp. GEM-RC1]
MSNIELTLDDIPLIEQFFLQFNSLFPLTGLEFLQECHQQKLSTPNLMQHYQNFSTDYSSISTPVASASVNQKQAIQTSSHDSPSLHQQIVSSINTYLLQQDYTITSMSLKEEAGVTLSSSSWDIVALFDKAASVKNYNETKQDVFMEPPVQHVQLIKSFSYDFRSHLCELYFRSNCFKQSHDLLESLVLVTCTSDNLEFDSPDYKLFESYFNQYSFLSEDSFDDLFSLVKSSNSRDLLVQKAYSRASLVFHSSDEYFHEILKYLMNLPWKNSKSTIEQLLEYRPIQNQDIKIFQELLPNYLSPLFSSTDLCTLLDHSLRFIHHFDSGSFSPNSSEYFVKFFNDCVCSLISDGFECSEYFQENFKFLIKSLPDSKSSFLMSMIIPKLLVHVIDCQSEEETIDCLKLIDYIQRKCPSLRTSIKSLIKSKMIEEKSSETRVTLLPFYCVVFDTNFEYFSMILESYKSVTSVSNDDVIILESVALTVIEDNTTATIHNFVELLVDYPNLGKFPVLLSMITGVLSVVVENSFICRRYLPRISVFVSNYLPVYDANVSSEFGKLVSILLFTSFHSPNHVSYHLS